MDEDEIKIFKINWPEIKQKVIQNRWIIVAAITTLISVILLIKAGYVWFATGAVDLKIVILILVGILILLGCERLVTGRWPDWTGFRPKTLWDWMQLLIIPIVLSGGVYWLNESARQSDQAIADQRAQIERNIASDNLQEAALQTYLDRMAELLIKENLSDSGIESGVSAVAKARTLTVLRRLDGNRKGVVLRFLYEAKLIDKDKIVINLYGADLREADLPRSNLKQAGLSGIDLRKANLFFADLRKADLREADLREANLSWTDMSEADLVHSNLSGANLSPMANLREANLPWADLSGANLSESYVNQVDLTEAKLIGANLNGTSLLGTKLIRASLIGADLGRADLIYTNLSEADLSEANLKEARLQGVDLSKAKYTKNNKILKDTIWPEGFDPDAAGAIRVNE